MLVLASVSPRRREILKMAGFEFEVCPADVDEYVEAGTPVNEAVVITAKQKAMAVKDRFEIGDVILAADTVVSINGKIIGKPKDKEDAFGILKTLSGNTHTVYTGYCIIKNGKVISDSVATRVTFRPLDDSEINQYIQSGEPMDKAGAYGLQGRACSFASRIDGEYFNVVGLPIATIIKYLK